MNVDGIIAYAKDALLALRDYPPCVFVELDSAGYVCIALPQLGTAPNALERARISFFGGRKFGQTTAKQFKGQKVTGVCSIAKVWYTITLESEAKDIPYVKPSLNPRRKEGFSINTLDADRLLPFFKRSSGHPGRGEPLRMLNLNQRIGPGGCGPK